MQGQFHHCFIIVMLGFLWHCAQPAWVPQATLRVEGRQRSAHHHSRHSQDTAWSARFTLDWPTWQPQRVPPPLWELDLLTLDTTWCSGTLVENLQWIDLDDWQQQCIWQSEQRWLASAW